MEDDILFLCDPQKNIDCPKTYCYENGGECYHAIDIRFAKNFRKLPDGPYIENYPTNEEN